MSKHVIKNFLAWKENSTIGNESIDNHLAQCITCRKYYEKMSLLLDRTDIPRNPKLQPDPYLPARIVALANAQSSAHGKGFVNAARWSLASLTFALAVFIGIVLGKGLAAPSTQYKTSEIISAYYNAVSQENFSSGLESIVESTQKDKQ